METTTTTPQNMETTTTTPQKADRSSSDCSASSDSPPAQHPSGAWTRSDYVKEYEKLHDTLKAVVNGSFYGDSTGYFHCDRKAMRQAKAHLDSLQNGGGAAAL